MSKLLKKLVKEVIQMLVVCVGFLVSFLVVTCGIKVMELVGVSKELITPLKEHEVAISLILYLLYVAIITIVEYFSKELVLTDEGYYDKKS